MVEFALVTPLLFLVLFGIIEFGWAFGQHLDVRHGTREASRLVAVNHREGSALGSAQNAQIFGEACDTMDLAAGTEIELARDGTAVGDHATVAVSAPLDTLTGFLDFALAGVTLRSEVGTRLEQEATWLPATGGCS